MRAEVDASRSEIDGLRADLDASRSELDTVLQSQQGSGAAAVYAEARIDELAAQVLSLESESRAQQTRLKRVHDELEARIAEHRAAAARDLSDGEAAAGEADAERVQRIEELRVGLEAMRSELAELRGELAEAGPMVTQVGTLWCISFRL